MQEVKSVLAKNIRYVVIFVVSISILEGSMRGEYEVVDKTRGC